jgi:pilus assembly protein CpaE
MAQAEKLRMMLVDDSAETREYLRKLLQFEPQIELVGVAANGKDAVDMALEIRPELILMDINMPVMDGISAAELIFRELPSVRVVMMSVQSEMAYLRRAMQVGAREFLMKPFTHEELINILGRVGSLAPSATERAAVAPAREWDAGRVQMVRQASLVAIFSPRGGAGCSTLALSLAIALQGQRKAQVLVIDGNLRFGALDAMLNLQVSRNITDLLPSLADADPDMMHSTTLPHHSGIRLLAAPPKPEMADLVAVEDLAQIVALGQHLYDYMVVDLGSNLNDMALNLMDMASRIFVVLTPDIPAIKNASLFLEVCESLGYEADKIQLVLNRAQPRSGLNAEAIERHIKKPIVASIPDSPRIAQAAINRGVPLILFEREMDKSMPVTQQLLALVERVPQPGEAVAETFAMAEEAPESSRVPSFRSTQEAPKKGFLGRLLKRG